MTALTIIGLGFALGLRHALDTDHLVAVSTIVSERKGMVGSALVGALWGLGHTVSLLVVGILMIAFRIEIPEEASRLLEFAVAAMLILLGVHLLWKLSRGGILHTHAHVHREHPHTHAHVHGPGHVNDHTHEGWVAKKFVRHLSSGRKSIFVGMVHGLAGSGALMLMVLATIPSPALGLVYIVAFGVGAAGGMLVMSTIISIPFLVSSHRSELTHEVARGLSGALSVLFGCYYAWQIALSMG